MKNLTFITLLLLLGSVFLSCDPETEVPPEEISVVGTWKILRQVDICADAKTHVVNSDSCELQSRYVIKGDGTWTAMEKGQSNTNENLCVEYTPDGGNWWKSGNKLTFNDGSGNEEFTIFNLTKTELKIGYLKNGFCTDGVKMAKDYVVMERVN